MGHKVFMGFFFFCIFMLVVGCRSLHGNITRDLFGKLGGWNRKGGGCYSGSFHDSDNLIFMTSV